jgi:hypothetical protein
MQFRAEEVNQRSQFTGIPRKPSQTPTNVAACEIAFSVKLCSSAIVVAQTPHEAARRRREAALVEADEADDVAERWVGNSVPLRRHDPLRGLPFHIRRQLAAGHQQTQGQCRGRRALPRRRVDDGDGLLGSHTNGQGNEEREARAAPKAVAQRQERLGA